MSKLNFSHGGRNERLYLVWMDMRRRCRDEKDAEYKNYGGRGISVCEEWESYDNFRTWAIKNGYDKGAKRGKCTLDRIDVDKNYSPENCRFVDMVIQCNNKRTNVFLEYNGKRMTAAQWEREMSYNAGLIVKRLGAGWSAEKAILTPPRKTNRKVL